MGWCVTADRLVMCRVPLIRQTEKGRKIVEFKSLSFSTGPKSTVRVNPVFRLEGRKGGREEVKR